MAGRDRQTRPSHPCWQRSRSALHSGDHRLPVTQRRLGDPVLQRWYGEANALARVALSRRTSGHLNRLARLRFSAAAGARPAPSRPVEHRNDGLLVAPRGERVTGEEGEHARRHQTPPLLLGYRRQGAPFANTIETADRPAAKMAYRFSSNVVSYQVGTGDHRHGGIWTPRCWARFHHREDQLLADGHEARQRGHHAHGQLAASQQARCLRLLRAFQLQRPVQPAVIGHQDHRCSPTW